MRIVMIGAGNVATHICKTLASKDCTLVQVWSRSLKSASELATLTGCEPVTSFAEIVRDADIYIISVVDSALDGVVAQLCAECRNGVFVHTAGSMPMQIFEGRAEHYGVMYPMQTFTKRKQLDFKVIPCFVEASDNETLKVVKEFAALLSDNVYELSGDDRRWLHVAAVFACNFSNACCSMASRILKEHGLDFSVMLPLVDETMRKLHSLSPEEAQTGPAVREDYNVMGRHLDMLDNELELKNVYNIMSNIIIENKKQKQ